MAICGAKPLIRNENFSFDCGWHQSCLETSGAFLQSKEREMRTFKICAAAAILVALTGTGQAALVSYAGNQAGFLSATGAVSIGALPGAGLTGTVVGSVTFTDGGGSSIFFGAYSNEISGNDIAISGAENFNMAIAGGAYSIGFNLHEPSYEQPVPSGFSSNVEPRRLRRNSGAAVVPRVAPP
jgi:hypothetical protein